MIDMQSHHPTRTVTIWYGNKFLPFKNNLPKQDKRITYGRHHSRSVFRTLFIFLLGLMSGPHSPTGLSRFHCIWNDPVLGGPEIRRGNHQCFPTVFIIIKIKHNFYVFTEFLPGFAPDVDPQTSSTGGTLFPPADHLKCQNETITAFPWVAYPWMAS